MTRSPLKPLAPRDFLVLVALSEGPNHGYGLIKAVEERSDHGVTLDPANLYRLLRRLRKDGWIVENEASAEPVREGGPPRRTYAITDAGRRVMEVEVERLEALLQQARGAVTEGRS